MSTAGFFFTYTIKRDESTILATTFIHLDKVKTIMFDGKIVSVELYGEKDILITPFSTEKDYQSWSKMFENYTARGKL